MRRLPLWEQLTRPPPRQMTATIMPADLVAAWKPDYVAPFVAFLCHKVRAPAQG